MDCPPQIPDLNPRDNLWDALQKTLADGLSHHQYWKMSAKETCESCEICELKGFFGLSCKDCFLWASHVSLWHFFTRAWEDGEVPEQSHIVKYLVLHIKNKNIIWTNV